MNIIDFCEIPRTMAEVIDAGFRAIRFTTMSKTADW